MSPNNTKLTPPPDRKLPQHGVKGAYYGGKWVDLEDCAGTFQPDPEECSGCVAHKTCPRSQSRNTNVAKDSETLYDVVIIGGGCIGASIARELSRYALKTLLLESADGKYLLVLRSLGVILLMQQQTHLIRSIISCISNKYLSDVSQGATKGNSGIVHAGYDDKPGSVRARFCWSGNQMFPQLDRELRFGYQKNGSLVVATNKKELKVLDELLERGKTNGVQNLRIIQKEELFELEPALHPDVIAALHAPDAGNVIPYEFAIALAENAVDNGVELRIRREVTDISKKEDGYFHVDMRHWEPKDYIDARRKLGKSIDGSETKEISLLSLVLRLCISFPASILAIEGLIRLGYLEPSFKNDTQMVMTVVAFISSALVLFFPASSSSGRKRATVLKDIVDKCPPPVGVGDDGKVKLADMFTGGSGSRAVVHGQTVGLESVKTRYVVNAAGSFSDQIARMIGDDSFYIKPRIGDYILLNRNQGYLTHHTIFPCPDPVLGKGVLVQTTLWGNLILGPTARDMHNPDARDMSNESVQEYILSKCKKLCPYFDPKETIHAFAGARSKSSRGDWIIEPSSKDANFIHVAGIDSPGLAGAPAISLHVVDLLKSAGLKMPPNVTFNPNRAPIITPKNGLRGLKMGPIGKNDSNGLDEAKMASNVVCKCEKVTELEVVRALHRSLPIDSTQGIRKRTRAGMGHCQGDADNYFCEGRVKAIIARENGTSCDEVGGRPWPATSTLSQRWVYKDETQQEDLQKRMDN